MINRDKQSVNESELFSIFWVFHFVISGILDNIKHSPKMYTLPFTFLVFHLDISGNDDKLLHL